MDIFEELGIKRYINAQDTFTKYGASCMSEASLRAMYEISRSWVDLDEVQRKAGDAIAKLTHNEGAYLTNGAAGGLRRRGARRRPSRARRRRCRGRTWRGGCRGPCPPGPP